MNLRFPRPGANPGATVTARGLALMICAGPLFAVGLRFGYPELAVLGAASLIAVLYALAHTAWRPRLGVDRHAEPDRVARGEAATMTLTVHNSSRLRAANLVATDRCGGRPVPVPLLRLRPGRDTTVAYPVPTRRRGVVPVGPLRVTRRDPLGLTTVARAHGERVTVWVHPRIHALRAVPAGALRSLDGRVDRVPHGTITFDSLREYVVGDELRRVHWRSSAKLGELMVREQLDTSLPRIVVLLDNRATAHPRVVDGVVESFEAACEAAASVVAAAVREDLAVTLHLVGDAGSGGIGGYLDRLAAADLVRPTAPDDPLRTATRLLRQERPGDTLVFLTGPAGRDDLGTVSGLRAAYPAIIVAVFDDAGGDRPPGGAAAGVTVIDATDGADFAAAWNGVRG